MIEIMLGYRDEARHLVNAAIEGIAVRVAPLLDWIVDRNQL